MASQAKFRPVKTADKGWMINIPENLATTGKRERYFFRTKEVALAVRCH